MTYVSRDPFARTTLYREAYPANGQTCKWCGQTTRGGRLYSYSVQSDGGRESEIPGLFCSVSCMRTYHEG